MNYYNEHDPFAAAWLRKLIEAGLIPAGVVDERSIEDVTPNELERYAQCHFFAGIGGWSLALQLAGVPATTRLFSGSCPCQPFSSAGKGGGFADERHLWPAFHHLIRVCRPAIVVGEQVASPDGLRWCDLVQDDLEMEGYSFGKADLCAAGVGAPHIRQRLYWVGRLAHPELPIWRQECQHREDGHYREDGGWKEAHGKLGACGEVCGLGIPHSPGQQQGQPPSLPMGHWDPAEPAGGACGMAHPKLPSQPRQRPVGSEAVRLQDATGSTRDGMGCRLGGEHGDAGVLQEEGPTPVIQWTSPLHGFWRDADWLFCRDGKWRPVEPGSFPLVDGFSKGMGLGSDPCPPINPYSAEARVMRLKGYGNAICVQVAAEFLKAALNLP